jgi:hypothetical protein
MLINETIKGEIVNFCNSQDLQGLDISEVTEKVLDFLIDEELVDLSDDEDGDMYEGLSNTVWDFIEENVNL